MYYIAIVVNTYIYDGPEFEVHRDYDSMHLKLYKTRDAAAKALIAAATEYAKQDGYTIYNVHEDAPDILDCKMQKCGEWVGDLYLSVEEATLEEV